VALLDWMETILRRESYLALLLERPRVHARLLRLLGAARWPARYLLKHPGVIDELATVIGKRQETRPLIVVDNTMLGPVYQQPLKHGADIIVYSLTKYVGGHSDLVAGGAIGRADLIAPVRKIRSAFGMQLDPHSCWMIGRSLETLHLRMERAATSARKIASWLNGHSKVERLFNSDFNQDAKYASAYKRFCSGGGSTFSFAIKGGLEGAFKFLNSLQLFKLAVSLGGTESLISHPASTTQSGVKKEIRDAVGVTDSLIRVSIGLENPDDLIADLDAAFKVLPG
jgi:methionine-gamma-lyase